MKKLFFFLIGSLLISNTALAELKIGAEGGIVWADIRAEETAQILANASGSSVSYEYDQATWMGRVFGDYAFNSEIHAEIGYFLTGSLDATYKISGSQATESYDAMGIDFAIVLHTNEAFFKAGMHSSELNGSASLTIGGTSYAVTESISGSGFLVGGGFESDDSRFGLTYYSDMGGDADSDMTFLSYGVKF
ncbi:hypothetical protein N9V79_01550 [Candidatus Pelagibacter bacterium]|nr:hypothetical protein [Candidatus Pelagibacter bacterium]